MIILAWYELVAVSLGWPLLMLLLLVHRSTRGKVNEWRQLALDQRRKHLDTECELRGRIDRLKDRIAKTETPPIVPAEGYVPACLKCHRPVKFDQVSLFVCPDCMEKNIDTLMEG